ncbi:MAG: hypothetical protein CMK07_06575 [Ponticaulis sp.]|nr:hypothetical protein [Ponticaulis sp.]
MLLLIACSPLLTACTAARTTAKVVSLPVKATYYAGKGVYLTGKGVYKVGEGVYKVGSIPVKFTGAALDTTSDILIMTLMVVNAAGTVSEITRTISTVQLEAELLAIQGATNIIEILVSEPI